MIRADLHIHTYYSDGAQSPADVVRAAKAAGLSLISVTDHDNSNGSAEVKELAKKAGILSVDGEEISAYLGEIKFHTLCYHMDKNTPQYAAFNKKIKEGAEARTFDILKKLARVGVNISYSEVIRERKCSKSPVHGMYIAAAGARKGYASSPSDFYARYLNYGRAGFSCLGRPTPEETVEAAISCGGFCSVAHPGRITMEKEELLSFIKKLKNIGLGGIEAVYSGHTDIQTQYYRGIAEEVGLLVTGGSDTHHAGGSRRVGTPEFYPDEKLLSALNIY